MLVFAEAQFFEASVSGICSPHCRKNIMIRCTMNERTHERFLSRVASPRLSSASQFKLHADEPYVRPMQGFKVPRDSPSIAFDNRGLCNSRIVRNH